MFITVAVCMFTYLDPEIREQLIAMGKLVCIDDQGRRMDIRKIPEDGTSAISMLGPIPLPVSSGEFKVRLQWYACVRHTEISQVEELAHELTRMNAQRSFARLASSMSVNSVMVMGEPDDWENPLVRVHSNCLTGDVFGSLRCDCGPQLAAAFRRIQDERQGGLIIYMAGHEGRGIGLWAKAATYILQDAGQNTYQANRMLGLPDDSRDFGDAAVLLRYFLNDRPFRLLTNNPKKVNDLYEKGLTRMTRIEHISGINDINREYMRAKRAWGHEIDDRNLTDQ